jgi:hypothetical protein
LKYSDNELTAMRENPAIKDKYIVRFMQADYLHTKAPYTDPKRHDRVIFKTLRKGAGGKK